MADVNDSIVAGAKFGEKLIDTVGKGLSGISSPRQIKRIGKASYEAMSLIGKGIRENADIIKDPQLSGVYERFVERSIYNGLLNEQNVENIIRLAQSSIPGDTPCSAEPVDDCWFTRFMNYAGEISNEEMQKIWAQILAGEIKRPGGFSLRTLDVVRNISRNEALLFQKISSLVLFDSNRFRFFSSKTKILNKYGVTLEDILLLKDAGLVADGETVQFLLNDLDPVIHNICSNEFVLMIKKERTHYLPIHFGVYSLSQAGRELFTLLNNKVNFDYICDVADMIYQENKSSISGIEVHKIHPLNDSQFECESIPLKVWGEHI